MPIDSMARRADAVLVVIDEQERLTVAMEHRGPVLAATSRLIRVAALLGVPVIVTRQYPKGLGDLDSELSPAIEAAERSGVIVGTVDKVAFDCFGEPVFRDTLRQTGRGQVIIAGMETHICVAQTALTALRSRLDVHVVADACCCRSDSSHRAAIERLRSAGAVVTTSESVMYELVGEAATEEFRALLGIVKE